MRVQTASGASLQGDYDLQNPLGSFADVVRRVVAQPADFFPSLPRRGNFLGPLVFGLICITRSPRYSAGF